MMVRMIRSLLVTAMCLVGFGLPLAAQIEASPVSVLLVTGANNHDWPFTSAHMAQVLEKTGRFKVVVTTKPGDFLAKRDLSSFDVVYLDYNGPRWGKKAEDNFMAAVRSGLGVSVIHAANNAFVGWKEYEALCVYCWRRGTGHGKFHRFDVDIVDWNHPITRDMPPLKNHPDELYHKLVHMHDARFRLLMTARSSLESGGSGRSEIMALVTQVGKGRVFHTPLGHVWPNQENTRASLRDPQLQLLIARGTEWAATGRATLKAEDFGLEPFVGTLAKRPGKVWVRRCVLDGRPRMIVIQLDACLSVAFDAASCRIYRVWGGGLDLKETVHDGVHGPQPRTVGRPYATEYVDPEATEADRRQFLGYVIKKGRITLRYRLVKRPHVLIGETLEHVTRGRPVLQRRFQISGIANGEKPVRFVFFAPRASRIHHRMVQGGEELSMWTDEMSEPHVTFMNNGLHEITITYRMGEDD